MPLSIVFLFCFIGKSREGRPQALGFQWYLFHSHLNASPSSVTEDIQKVMSHIQRSSIFEKFFFSVETEYKMLRNRVSPHLMNNTWVLHQNFETFVFRFKTNLWLWIFQHKTLQPFGITIFIESVRRGRNQRGAAIFFAESLLRAKFSYFLNSLRMTTHLHLILISKSIYIKVFVSKPP